MHFNKQNAAVGTSNVWIIMFLDMLALLLAFFVLLFSMSTLDKEKWEDLQRGLDLPPNLAQPVQLPPAAINTLEEQPEMALDLDYLRNLLLDKLQSHPLLAAARVKTMPDHLIVTLPSDSLFKSARATVLGSAKEALVILGWHLTYIKNRIEIRGHTDPNRIHAGPFVSNWELSLERARSVLKVLRQGGYQKEALARGLADSRFFEIPTNLPRNERYRLARSVDIVIFPSEGMN